MQIPLQISLHGIAPSDALQQEVREMAGRLERHFDHITSCRVVLELDGRHQQQGRQFRVRVDLTVPGREIVANREHHEDVHVALREAFADARRQLEGHVRIQRGR